MRVASERGSAPETPFVVVHPLLPVVLTSTGISAEMRPVPVFEVGDEGEVVAFPDALGSVAEVEPVGLATGEY